MPHQAYLAEISPASRNLLRGAAPLPANPSGALCPEPVLGPVL
jgi:hypothetical protein